MMPVIKLTTAQAKSLLIHWQKYIDAFESDYIEDDSGFQMTIAGEEEYEDMPTASEIRAVKTKHKFILAFRDKIEASMRRDQVAKA